MDMTDSAICRALSASLGALYFCEPHGDYVRLRTPYLYPDGDGIDVFVRADAAEGMVCDLGETVRWLRMQSVSEHRTKKQKAIVQDVCLTHGVEFFHGMLMVRYQGEDGIAGAVTRLSQACLRVSDLWYSFRSRTVESFGDEVAEFLTENQIAYHRNETLVGRSTRLWRPDFHTRSARRSSLVYLLSTGSRAVAKQKANNVLAAWFDLQQLKSGLEALQFVSLVDDTVDVWSSDDLSLVESNGLSTVAHWSDPDNLLAALRAE